LEQIVRPMRPDIILAPEARGYLLAAPLADRLHIGLVAVRKPGKLPGPVLSQRYALEYGENRLEIEVGIQISGRRVVVVDDVLATGGTVEASAELAERVGGEIAGFASLIELKALAGRQRLARWAAEVASTLIL
jgi:adenine phosphoribosyltransferase